MRPSYSNRVEKNPFDSRIACLSLFSWNLAGNRLVRFKPWGRVVAIIYGRHIVFWPITVPVVPHPISKRAYATTLTTGFLKLLFLCPAVWVFLYLKSKHLFLLRSQKADATLRMPLTEGRRILFRNRVMNPALPWRFMRCVETRLSHGWEKLCSFCFVESKASLKAIIEWTWIQDQIPSML